LFRKSYDANKPIETLFAQIKEAAAVADAGRQPYTHPHILNNAFLLIQNTGHFKESCREWNRKPTNDKNWATFKSHFATAAQELCEEQTPPAPDTSSKVIAPVRISKQPEEMS
jgi:hypothetical protein